MVEKKEARELPNNTGNVNISSKNTKRKRIKRFELIYKWRIPVEVRNLERDLI